MAVPFCGNQEVVDRDVEKRNPVGAIFAIKKAKSNSIQRLEGTEAIAAILANIPYVESYSVELHEKILLIVESVAARVRINKMKFAKDPSLWEEIEGMTFDTPSC